MSYLVFALSLVLLVAGVAGGYLSLDLLPTSAGVLYALGGAVAVSVAVLALAVGVLIRRIDALAKEIRVRTQGFVATEGEPFEEPYAAPIVLPDEPAGGPDAPAETIADPAADGGEEPINENRSGRLPTLGEMERAIETPEAPPSLIGRYSSGGANYMIFADGSIEAETREGTFKFASMGDFKQYLSDLKDGRR